MKQITDYITTQENLFPLSAMISGTILLFIFVIAQILYYSSSEETDLLTKKMEIRELVKLKFTPKGNKNRKQSANPLKAKQHKIEQPELQPVQQTQVVASLMQGLEIKSLISKKSMSNQKAANHKSGPVTEIAMKSSSFAEAFANYDMDRDVYKHASSLPGGRKGGLNNGRSPTVQTGSSSGRGAISSLDGDAISGRASRRTTHSPGSGSGGPKITFPTGSGGDDATLDLHALIKWMKKHPGAIPKLVQYEMGHKRGDLSSAVSFSINNRRFRLFLSCNEVELLLRICLVEGDYFTLLKDSGIREQSNYLTIGDVRRLNGQIQSLISSRKAPRDKAASFYSIFWSWWQHQTK